MIIWSLISSFTVDQLKELQAFLKWEKHDKKVAIRKDKGNLTAVPKDSQLEAA